MFQRPLLVYISNKGTDTSPKQKQIWTHQMHKSSKWSLTEADKTKYKSLEPSYLGTNQFLLLVTVIQIYNEAKF